MVEIELCDPTLNTLVGVSYLRGTTEDIYEGETTEVARLSLGLLLITINFIWIVKN